MRDMKTSERGIELVKSFEGFSAEPYMCPAGVWTIGYGHVIQTGEEFDTPLSEDDAIELLMKDLEPRERMVCALVRVPISQLQFDALVSLCYNIGGTALKKSTLLKCLNAGEYDSAADEFPKWNRGGGKVLKGLTLRRQAEKELFEEGMQ